MEIKHLHLLKLLSRGRNTRLSYVKWTIEGITDDDIISLQSQNLIFVDTDGFVGDLISLHLTAKGYSFIEDFCESCECMPCDCDWGIP